MHGQRLAVARVFADQINSLVARELRAGRVTDHLIADFSAASRQFAFQFEQHDAI